MVGEEARWLRGMRCARCCLVFDPPRRKKSDAKHLSSIRRQQSAAEAEDTQRWQHRLQPSAKTFPFAPSPGRDNMLRDAARSVQIVFIYFTARMRLKERCLFCARYFR